jgi:uncharacterized glyoxalase superfamily protein PhnB
MMNLVQVTPILNVVDVPASIAWFEKLGWKRHFCWNAGGMIACAADANAAGPADFAGIASGKCEMFLCRDGQGSRGGPLPRHAGDRDTGGVWMSWWVASPAEVDAVHALAIEHGMTVTREPADEPWGVREFHLRHPDGHTFRVSAGTCDE